MRTFIAIKIAPEKKLLDVYSTVKKSLAGEAINWVSENKLHLTLRFIGETSHCQVSEIIQLLESICEHFKPFQFELKGLGFFKSRNHPRVLFLKGENVGSLKQLAASIEEKIVSLGFENEEKAFNPHLTLGRIKFIDERELFYSLVNRFVGTHIQVVTVSEVIFYQSILSSGGAIYKPLKIIKLKNLK
jgi:2'-5' RNA ligase